MSDIARETTDVVVPIGEARRSRAPQPPARPPSRDEFEALKAESAHQRARIDALEREARGRGGRLDAPTLPMTLGGPMLHPVAPPTEDDSLTKARADLARAAQFCSEVEDGRVSRGADALAVAAANAAPLGADFDSEDPDFARRGAR